MTLRTRILLPHSLPFICLCFLTINTAAAPAGNWVGTWAASPMAQPNPGGKFGSADTTFREIVHVSLGGSQVRIILTNELGLDPLTIGEAHIALSTGSGNIGLAAARALTFGGRSAVTIPPGAMVVSDPSDLKLPPFANVAVSLFVPPQPMRQLTHHTLSDQTCYEASGNLADAKTLVSAGEISSWPFLKGIDVISASNSASIVAFGDSITGGYRSTRDANANWPDVLARRLQANKKTVKLSVLNEGIGGNQILRDMTSVNALARFDRDVLAQGGVKYLIVLEGINDIRNFAHTKAPADAVSAQDLIFGLSQLAERAHIHGIKVIGATLTPYDGAEYFSPDGEAIRQAVNHWIRITSQFDGVIDFDKATQDPAHPSALLPADDSGDHLHPNDAGYKAMGDAIDLKLFTGK
jgi:lysophospholipase L1-like esterase